MWAAGHGNLDSTPPLTPNIAGILGPFSGSDSSGYPALALSSQTQAMVTSWMWTSPGPGGTPDPGYCRNGFFVVWLQVKGKLVFDK